MRTAFINNNDVKELTEKNALFSRLKDARAMARKYNGGKEGPYEAVRAEHIFGKGNCFGYIVVNVNSAPYLM